MWRLIARNRTLGKQVLPDFRPGAACKEVNSSANKLCEQDKDDPSRFVPNTLISYAVNDHPDHGDGREKREDR